MELSPQLYMAKVMHKRFFPQVNGFTYNVYYMVLPLTQLDECNHGLIFGVDRPALFSFYRKDHGARDGGDLRLWAAQLFAQHGVDIADKIVSLVAMPRIMGFVFNPVSFWMVRHPNGKLCAVIAEVNNTFGETHSYVCLPPEGDVIDQDMILRGEKLFHVSPFLERSGDYAFRFASGARQLGIWIDYFHANGEKQLATSLIGDLRPLTAAALLEAFITIPFVTIKTVLLIHWQAIKLVWKRIRYINKPPQLPKQTSRAGSKLTNL